MRFDTTRREYIQGIVGAGATASITHDRNQPAYFSGEAIDVAGDSVEDVVVRIFHIPSKEGLLESGANVELVAKSSPSDSSGVFFFDRPGQEIRISDLDSLREKYSENLVVAGHTSEIKGNEGPWFIEFSPVPDDFLRENTTGFFIPLSRQILYGPTVAGQAEGTITVWRAIDFNDHTDQDLFIELTETEPLADKHTVSGFFNFIVPERVTVDYGLQPQFWTGDPNTGTARWNALHQTIEETSDTKLPRFPLARIEYSQYGADDRAQTEINQAMVEGIIGLTPVGTAVGFLQTMSTFIDQTQDGFAHRLGDGVELSLNEQDTVKGMWNSATTSMVFKINLSLKKFDRSGFGARCMWNVYQLNSPLYLDTPIDLSLDFSGVRVLDDFEDSDFSDWTVIDGSTEDITTSTDAMHGDSSLYFKDTDHPVSIRRSLSEEKNISQLSLWFKYDSRNDNNFRVEVHDSSGNMAIQIREYFGTFHAKNPTAGHEAIANVDRETWYKIQLEDISFDDNQFTVKIFDTDESQLGVIEDHPFVENASGWGELHIVDYLGNNNVSDPVWIDYIRYE